MPHMEIPHHIIIQAIVASQTSPINTGLKDTLFALEGFSAVDFLGASRPEQVERTEQAIHGYASLGIFNIGRSDVDRVAALAPVIVTIYPYLKRGIEETRLQPLLIFLMVNALLQIPIPDLVNSEEIPDPKKTALSAAINAAYKNGIGDFTPEISGSRHTANLVREYLEGVAEMNVDKVYQFVDRYQQSNRPPLNYLVSNLVAFLYQFDPPAAVRLLQAAPQPMAYATYLFFFPKHVLSIMAKDCTITEKWLLLEIIRQLALPKNRQSEDADISPFTSAVRQIAQIDFGYFKQTARHFHQDKIICAGVGAFLPNTSNPQISEVLTECYPATANNSDLLARNAMANAFAERASENQLKHFLTIISQMWLAFMDEAVESGNTYSQGILLTDYAELVPSYYIRVAPQSDLEDIMYQTIRKAKWIDSHWARTQAQQSNSFRSMQSILYLLSFAYKEKQMRNISLEADYIALLRHPIQLSRFATDDLKAKFSKAIENMQWHTASEM
jgi:hypothetical protein